MLWVISGSGDSWDLRPFQQSARNTFAWLSGLCVPCFPQLLCKGAFFPGEIPQNANRSMSFFLNPQTHERYQGDPLPSWNPICDFVGEELAKKSRKQSLREHFMKITRNPWNHSKNMNTFWVDETWWIWLSESRAILGPVLLRLSGQSYISWCPSLPVFSLWGRNLDPLLFDFWPVPTSLTLR